MQSIMFHNLAASHTHTYTHTLSLWNVMEHHVPPCCPACQASSPCLLNKSLDFVRNPEYECQDDASVLEPLLLAGLQPQSHMPVTYSNPQSQFCCSIPLRLPLCQCKPMLTDQCLIFFIELFFPFCLLFLRDGHDWQRLPQTRRKFCTEVVAVIPGEVVTMEAPPLTCWVKDKPIVWYQS
jgi:hypothetical protein